jgi:hypothetical protein
VGAAFVKWVRLLHNVEIFADLAEEEHVLISERDLAL